MSPRSKKASRPRQDGSPAQGDPKAGPPAQNGTRNANVCREFVDAFEKALYHYLRIVRPMEVDDDAANRPHIHKYRPLPIKEQRKDVEAFRGCAPQLKEGWTRCRHVLGQCVSAYRGISPEQADRQVYNCFAYFKSLASQLEATDTVPNDPQRSERANEYLPIYRAIHSRHLAIEVASNSDTTEVAAIKSNPYASKQINARMLELMQTLGDEVLGWSAKKWADRLGCSKSAVQLTPTWRETLRGPREASRRQRTSSIDTQSRPSRRNKAKPLEDDDRR